MSFGWSVGDCFLLAKGLWKVTNLLRGQAVGSFRRYQTLYNQLEGVAKALYRMVGEIHEQGDTRFDEEIRTIHQLLKQFFSRIKKLEPHLGQTRVRHSLLGALRKITWPIHSEALLQLHANIMSQLQIISLLNQFRTGCIRPTAATDDFLSTFVFYFEDARLKTRVIDFVSISSWEDLHEFLLRIFPKDNPGHEVIRHQRYLIHKSDSDTVIQCSSPGIKPFRDVIKKHERVRMSVIFEYHERYEQECPRCKTKRPAEFSGVALSCDHCNLLLHFQDSYPDRPDPLTEIVLKDLRSSGLREFVQQSIREVKLSVGRSSPEADRDDLQLEGWIREKSTKLRLHRDRTTRQPEIRDFERVTLCKPRWPNLSHHRSYQKAVKQFSKTMKGLERHIQYLQSEDFPFAICSAFINSRAWGARYEQSTLRFLKSILQAYNNRTASQNWPPITGDLLQEYIDLVKIVGAHYHTSVLRIRCLLWIYWDVICAEREILLKCSKLLGPWSLPEECKREKTHLLIRALFTPHILFLVPIWLIHDLPADLLERFAKEKPLWLPKALQQLVMRPGAIALDYYFDCNLNKYFDTKKFLNDDESKKFTSVCRYWMEEVARKEGGLDFEHVTYCLEDMMDEGYI